MTPEEQKLKCLELAVAICRARVEHDEEAIVKSAETLYAFVKAAPEDGVVADKPRRGRPRSMVTEVSPAPVLE